MYQKKLIFAVGFSLLLCSGPQRKYDPAKKLPPINSLDTISCKETDATDTAASIIEHEVAEKEWAEAQDKLLKLGTKEAEERSIKLQEARAVLGQCAKILYGAIATGSSRNLANITLESARKDLDMSVPLQNIKPAEKWLRSYVRDSEKSLEMSFLIHPLEQIPCKTIKGVEALECAKSNTKENLEIMLLSEERLTKKHPDESADLNELKEFCPAWRIRSSEIEKIVEIDSHEEIQKFAAKLPAEPNKDTGYKSSPKYEVLFTALHNHAYYIMTGSLRRWVIEREKEFENEMNSKYPDYTKSKEVKDVEREGAVMEQILHSSRHRKSFYYKYKYLFRAMDHIGFEVDKKIPELSVIHTLLKKTRPDTIDDAYSEIRKLLNSGITKEKEYSVLKKYEEKLTPSLFAEMVKKYDKLQYDALREYFAKRANEKNSVWAPVCKI